jgi:AcrR family transcriptional regulator
MEAKRQRGRPPAFDHDEALEKALQVFWAQGYEGASMSDLTEAMGINRPSVYAAFGNKEALFRKALDRYVSGPVAYVVAAINEPTSRRVVEVLLTKSVEMLTNAKHPRGCLIVQGALSCGPGSDLVQRQLIAHRKSYEDALMKRFEMAREEGDLPPATEPASLARYIATVHQGMSVQATSGATKKELLAVVQHVLKLWP